MIIAKESCHWYDETGKPAYTIIGANGKERNTTLRDAKKSGKLVPSVTTILSILDKPGLNIWKQNNILLSAATLPKIKGESLEDWSKRVVVDAGEQGKEAAATGTAIHTAIERCFQGKDHDYQQEVALVLAKLRELKIKHTSVEQSFAHPSGYGGKIDFVGVDENSCPVVIDFKTTDFTAKKKKYHWPEMINQLAAYANGIDKGNARLINIFISRNLDTPQVDYYEWTADECTKGWVEFQLTLELWCVKKGYRPEVSA